MDVKLQKPEEEYSSEKPEACYTIDCEDDDAEEYETS